MARLIGTLLLIGFVWLILRRLLPRTQPTRRRSKPAAPRFEPTVRCARCGVHTPLTLARAEGDQYVCRDHDTEPEHEPRH